MADERALGHGERNSHPARVGHAHHRTKGAHFSIAYNERAVCLWRGKSPGLWNAARFWGASQNFVH